FLFIRHANDTQWVIPELARELARRGLDLEGGGHVLVELLPRALFAAHPEYFPCAPGGGRFDLGNVCTASPGALAVVRERAQAARAALPGATDFHLWGLDLAGGGWCACPRCNGLSPADQALAACNAVADTLGPGGRVFHLAYHDTLEPPRAVRPDLRVWAEFAPRERCYAHALDDPACATNAAYRRALDAHLELFVGRVHVFEYYGDAILFGGRAGRARRRAAPPRIHVRRPGGPRALARRARSGGPRRCARRPRRRGPPRACGRSRPRRHLGPARSRDHAPLLRGRARRARRRSVVGPRQHAHLVVGRDAEGERGRVARRVELDRPRDAVVVQALEVDPVAGREHDGRLEGPADRVRPVEVLVGLAPVGPPGGEAEPALVHMA